MTSAAVKALLLSIRPRYVAQIIAGEKTVELRRTRPRVPQGTRVLIYSTTPVQAIVAQTEIVQVLTGAPRQLWRKVGGSSGVTRTELLEYLANKDEAYALILGRVQALPRPIGLEEVRKRWPSFRAPQSFRYVDWCPVGGTVLLPPGVVHVSAEPPRTGRKGRSTRQASSGRRTRANTN